jgi:hypothetical protein
MKSKVPRMTMKLFVSMAKLGLPLLVSCLYLFTVNAVSRIHPALLRKKKREDGKDSVSVRHGELKRRAALPECFSVTQLEKYVRLGSDKAKEWKEKLKAYTAAQPTPPCPNRLTAFSILLEEDAKMLADDFLSIAQEGITLQNPLAADQPSVDACR